MTLLAASVWSRFIEFPFYQNALLAGLAVGVACAMLSVFVVYKRMAFIGEGISHAAFAGVGLAMLLQLYLPAMRDPFARDAVIAASCVATAMLIGWLTRHGHVFEDSAIGICLVGAMALGVVLLDVRTDLFRQMVATGAMQRADLGYTPSFHDILFGSILSVSHSDVWLACIEAGVVAALILAFFKELVFFACDEEAAEVFGVRTGLIYYGLLAGIGVTVVVAMRLLGVILCSALLILPGATANFWSYRIGRVTVAAVLSAAACIAVGLFLSITLRVLSTGPLVVLVMCAAFGVSWLIHALREYIARRTG